MIEYFDDCAMVSSDRLKGFFVGWPNPPSPEMHLKILKRSHQVVLAVDGETGNVVGFINAISDGFYCAYIPLLEVLPDYQSRGIGQELVRRMLKKLGRLYMIDLMCDTKVQPFYRELGMREATGMMIRNFDVQSGQPGDYNET